MAQRGRQKQSRETLDAVFAQVRSQFGLESDLQLVHHTEKDGTDSGAVSVLKVTPQGIVAVLDRVSGNAFVDMWAGMIRLAPHLGCLPGGVQILRS